MNRIQARAILDEMIENPSLHRHCLTVGMVMEAYAAHAISAHYTKWNVPYNTLLDKALLACDELTGFIIAAAQIPEHINFIIEVLQAHEGELNL